MRRAPHTIRLHPDPANNAMFPLSRIAVALSGVISVLSTSAACAQRVAAATDPQAVPVLPAITVDATRTAGSLTSKSTGDLKRALDQTVGSVGFVDADSLKHTCAFTLRDVLKDVPGVFVENRTVASARTAGSTAVFYPDEGRSVFAGMRYAF
ncbi:hypothetical protein WI36_22245 [Burkholderia ubonensis]|nr:hypothetical protein WI36_22245 [Burkholderia ubonensis]